MKLFKVIVETELMVISETPKDAVKIAIKNAPNEIGIYGKGNAIAINSIPEIPEDWKSVIPYSSESTTETRKCYEILSERQSGTEKGLDDKEVEEIIRIRQESKTPKEVTPETRPDPKPKELNWKETKSGRPLPKLRFNI